MNYFEIKTKYGVTFIQAEEEGGDIMKRNIGETERIIRAVVGTVLMAIAFYYRSWWGLVGLEVFATGVFGWSPLYKFFELSMHSKTYSGFLR